MFDVESPFIRLIDIEGKILLKINTILKNLSLLKKEKEESETANL